MIPLTRMGIARRAALVLRLGLDGIVGAFAAWAALALAIDGPGSLAGLLFVVCVALCLRIRPRWRTHAAIAILIAIVLGWWFALEPSNDRDWQDDVARLPGVKVLGNQLEVTNVRDFEWTGAEEGRPRWQTRTYSLADVRGVDLVLSDWGAPMVVHTILSWEFSGGQHLAISIETRKERDEAYSAVRGAFRQFELAYVVAEERDVLGVRARFRGESLRLYQLPLPPEEARELLLVYAGRIETLAVRPAWYNALTTNCTSTIRLHVLDMGLPSPWDWRLLLNGRLDELLHERGRIYPELSLVELRARCDVTQAAREAFGQDDFSARIRAGLPGPPATRGG